MNYANSNGYSSKESPNGRPYLVIPENEKKPFSGQGGRRPEPAGKKPDFKKSEGKKEPDGQEVYSPAENPGYVRRSPIQKWFNTFMIMNIPIIGWIYLLGIALKKQPDQRKDFAKAYLVYKLVFLLVALLILAFGLYAGMEVMDRLLRYMNML